MVSMSISITDSITFFLVNIISYIGAGILYYYVRSNCLNSLKSPLLLVYKKAPKHFGAHVLCQITTISVVPLENARCLPKLLLS